MIVLPVSVPITFYSLSLCVQERTINHLLQVLASCGKISLLERLSYVESRTEMIFNVNFSLILIKTDSQGGKKD